MVRPSPFRHVAVSPRDARQFVRRTLLALDHASIVEDAELLVSEVVTQVLAEGVNYAPISVAARPLSVRVEVTDPRPSTTSDAPEVDLRTTTGVGLGIVDAVSARWGAEPTDDGRIIWFELSVSDD